MDDSYPITFAFLTRSLESMLARTQDELEALVCDPVRSAA